MKLSTLNYRPTPTIRYILSLFILCALVFSPLVNASANDSLRAAAYAVNAEESSGFRLPAAVATPIFINEIHYDNEGTDASEAVEIAGPAGTDLTGLSLVFYNGTGGASYATVNLTGIISDQDSGFGTLSIPYAGIQNGSPDGLALVNASSGVIQFLSYEGAFTATNGPALGMTSVDIGVSQPGTTPISQTLQLTGTGTVYEDFTWSGPITATPGTVNTNQNFGVILEDTPPSVTSTTPASDTPDAAPGANISITFSEAVDLTAPWFTLSCSLSGSHTGAVSGTNPVYEIDPDVDFVYGDSCTLTVLAAQVSDQDANDPPDAMAEDYTLNFSVQDTCTMPYTPIYSIQGTGLAVAITGTVTTQGVVVGDFETNSGMQGFYLQAVDGDADAMTSDGIFVYTGSADTVSAGDLVRVTGYARERFNQSALNGSNSNSAAVPAANIIQCGSATASPVDVVMPFSSATDLERFEGMLVRFPQPLVISEYFDYDRYGELVLALPLDGEPRPFTSTALEEPGPAALAREAANLLRRITLDDGLGVQNPSSTRHPNGGVFGLDNLFRGGDTVQNAIGVMGYDFSKYRIHPTAPADYTPVNLRPTAPEAVGGIVRVAAMNTLNFFLTLDYPTGDPLDNQCGPLQTLECRGADADQPDEFARQRAKLVAALAALDADIIGLNEMENTLGVDPLGDPDGGILAGLNAIFGPGTYAAIDTGVIGTDAIRVGLIYRPAAVAPAGAYAVLDSTVDPRFLDTKSRPALAQTFEMVGDGERFTVVVNHLKSKGSDCNDVSDPDLGDGQGNCNLTRLAAAQALVDWLAADPTSSGDPDFLIMGDLNSYTMEDPIDAIRAGSDDTLGTADDYTNLIAAYQGPFAYSYVFNGQFGYLDHALANASLSEQVTGVTELHINSDEADLLDYDTSFKSAAQDAIFAPDAYRSSDHDPVLVGIDFYDRTDLPGYAAASHLHGGPRLGSLWHSGTSVLNGGTNDGVGVNASWTVGAGGGSVQVAVSRAAGYVSGWVDWNQDSDFEDEGEQILNNAAFSADETRTLVFDIPESAVISGSTFSARFRVYDSAQVISTGAAPVSLPTPDGSAGAGEVEDYQWSFGPTAVRLVGFNLGSRGMGYALLGSFGFISLLAAVWVAALGRKRR